MSALQLPASDFDAELLIGVLNEERRLSAAELMPRLGIVTHDTASAFAGFVKFLTIVIRARKSLERMGFTICRTGGEISDEYWIGKHQRSS
jgi:hypothetical protein